MNIALFDEMAGHVPLCQNHAEWKAYLEFCSNWFASRGVTRPLVVELGVERGGQQVYYEQLLNAEHVGIDYSDEFCVPTIKGDAFAPETMAALDALLAGRTIDLLFIDLDTRETTERAYKTYTPKVKGLVGIHNAYVLGSVTTAFWNKLKAQQDGRVKVEFVTNHPPSSPWHITPMGIGVVVHD